MEGATQVHAPGGGAIGIQGTVDELHIGTHGEQAVDGISRTDLEDLLAGPELSQHLPHFIRSLEGAVIQVLDRSRHRDPGAVQVVRVGGVTHFDPIEIGQIAQGHLAAALLVQ